MNTASQDCLDCNIINNAPKRTKNKHDIETTIPLLFIFCGATVYINQSVQMKAAPIIKEPCCAFL